jgi:uncharacterized heparinase superfamily protein
VNGNHDRRRLRRLALEEAIGSSRSAAASFVRWARFRSPTPHRLLFAPQDLRTADPTVAADIYSGYFVMGGRALATSGRSPFDFEAPSDAWGEAFYGFGWLRHLRGADTALARANAHALVNEFIGKGRGDRRLARRPQVLARRILSFLSHSPLILDQADHVFYQRFMRTLGRGVQDLERCLPASAPPTRLFALIALASAGLCCEGLEAVQERATRRLARELDRQFLPDGGHVSRNPCLMVELLLDLLPLRQTYASRGVEPPHVLVRTIDGLLAMLRMFRHGDGTLAHFNGMGRTRMDRLSTLLMYDDVRNRPMPRAPHSGYERLEAGATLVTADVGAPPPIRQSGKAHAGCLSFELSSGQHRIVVNCGAPPGNGAALLAARSTAAHSTAVVGETSSCRFLAPHGSGPEGRLAAWLLRRLGPVVLDGPAVVPVERHEGDLTASHDGYRAAFGLTHRRAWRLSPDGGRLDGEDAFTRDVAGAGAEAVAIRFHLHPSVTASPTGQGGAIVLVLPNGEAWRFDAGSEARLEESVFFAASDGARRTQQIVLAVEAGQASAVPWRFERLAGAEGAVR